MKKGIFKLTLLFAMGLIMSHCGEDSEKPKTIPEVTTAAVTDFTTTTATVGGEITGDGNSEITVSGVVYSSVVSVPTIADDKIELTDTEGDFNTILEDLNSGTTYHVRAFATNSKGTGYGDVENFTTGNAAPVATNVLVTGAVEVNGLVTGTYNYTDSENDAQSGSTFQWYVANDATGTGEAAIAGATALTYIIQEAHQGKFVRFGVTPKAGTGNLTGTEIKSTFAGAVGEPTTVTFTYNGQTVTYGIINSGTTGKKWLDRNLGASNVASSKADFPNYGDLFQWGRFKDGHQLVIRAGAADGDMTAVNGPASSPGGDPPYPLSTTDTPPNALFIIIPNGQDGADWRSPQNDNLWQGVNGINNPCPSEWRIATQAEWDAENLADMDDAYSKLKLTLTGFRSGLDAGFVFSADGGLYWTTTVDSGDPTQAIVIFLSDGGYLPLGQARAQGMACRCIKD